VLAIRFNPETKQRSLDILIWGFRPLLEQGRKHGLHQRSSRKDRFCPSLSPLVSTAPLLNSGQRLLRMEENNGRAADLKAANISGLIGFVLLFVRSAFDFYFLGMGPRCLDIVAVRLDPFYVLF
jgi:hypothetical protein